MVTIILDSTIHKTKKYVTLQFPYTNSIIEHTRKLSGASWSSSLRKWLIPWTVDLSQQLQSHFDGVALLDDLPLRNSEECEQMRPASVRHIEHSPEVVDALEKFSRYMRTRRYSDNTIKTYSDAISTFLKYHSGKKISEITNEDLIVFNDKYILANNYSSSFQNQVVNALKLFYKELYGSALDVNIIYRPKRENKLPNVLSKEEVNEILLASKNIKHRSMLSLIYSCGLRRGELLNLKLPDVDSGRKVLIIRSGKGKKDRIAPLSDRTILMLRDYYKTYKPKIWLFEGQETGTSYSEKSLECVLKQALARTKNRKPVTLHWLRHSYATHLLEGGTDLRYIQEILGHKSSKTTEIYTHVSTKSIQNIKSPFDDMEF